MFKKLRNEFILTNMVITTIIVVMAFSTIYVSASINSEYIPQSPIETPGYASSEFQEMIKSEIIRDRNLHLSNLAITLVLVGLSTELAVFCASKYYAEKSIKPVRDTYLKQKEFIANASHELKTPIASARANFEALGTTEQPWTNNVDSELDRASKLVGDLLALARTDGKIQPTAKKSSDLTKVIKRRAQLFDARLSQKTLTLDLPTTMTIKIAEADFIQILDILLDNAIKYSDQSITIKLTNKTLEVTNDGHKIPSSKLPKIFERFYQADKTAEGSGLGLSIAKAVADQNHWDLSATSVKNHTTFKLTF